MRLNKMLRVICIAAAVCFSSITAAPLLGRGNLPQPSPDSIMAHLEGLPPCYAKCHISEMHFDIFKPMSEPIGRWCHLSDYWTKYHLVPCVKANCKIDKFEYDTSGAWLGKYCTLKNGPGG